MAHDDYILPTGHYPVIVTAVTRELQNYSGWPLRRVYVVVLDWPVDVMLLVPFVDSPNASFRWRDITPEFNRMDELVNRRFIIKVVTLAGYGGKLFNSVDEFIVEVLR